jgi:hypothetical protein
MALRDDIQRKIEKKQAELLESERTYAIGRAAALAYIQALQDTLKSLPREPNNENPAKTLRPGSAVARARELILIAKRPMHLTELLKGLGRPVDNNTRASLTGALGAYVRRNEVFTRPQPNTFGLIELGHDDTRADEPPDDFGR